MHSRFPSPFPPPNFVYLSGKIHLHAKEGAEECGARAERISPYLEGFLET